MKAVVKTAPGPGSMSLREVPTPSPAKFQVLVAVKAIGVCGTDVHIRSGAFPVRTPVIVGHEFGGEIAGVGAGVQGWCRGDRVVAENKHASCGSCELCRTGNAHICLAKRAYGSESDGAMAEYFCIEADALHRIPDNVSYEQAALAEPLAVVNRGVVERAAVRPEGVAVVLGAGPIGLFAVQVFRAAGARLIVLAGAGKDAGIRLPLGLKLGADLAVNTEVEDLRTVVANCTGGTGADIVVEASGSGRAVQDALAIVGRGKTVSAIGLCGRPVTVDWDQAVVKEIDVRFSKSSTYMSWKRALGMISAGRVDAKSLITHRLSLEDWSIGLDLMETGEAVKVVLTI